MNILYNMSKIHFVTINYNSLYVVNYNRKFLIVQQIFKGTQNMIRNRTQNIFLVLSKYSNFHWIVFNTLTRFTKRHLYMHCLYCNSFLKYQKST